MQLTMSPAAMLRSLLSGIVLLVLGLAVINAVHPAGIDLVFSAVWIVAVLIAGAGLVAAVRGKRTLVGLGAVMSAAGVVVAFYVPAMPGPVIWTVLLFVGIILKALGSKDDSRLTAGGWVFVLARISIGWAWLDNAQDHLKGVAAWVPGGGGFLNTAKGALTRGAPAGTQGAQPLGWFGDPAYIGFVKDTLVPNGDLWAGLTISGEMTFGVLLAVGLLTPIAAVGSMWHSLNYILVKGAFVHGAYTDKTFFMVAAVLFATAAGLSYGIDASLSKVVPARLAEWLLGARPAHDDREPLRQPSVLPA